MLSAVTLAALLIAPVVATGSGYAAFTRDLSLSYSHFKKSLSLASKKEGADKASGLACSCSCSCGSGS